jgi:predicted enzyme related to lactoylglutathione lyase
MSKFIWHDLMTPDMDGAQKFYCKVIGWDIVDAGMPDGNYRLLNVGKDGAGGIMGFRPEDDKKVPPFWSGYIYTPDVGKAAQQAVKLGGKIFKEPEIVPETVEFAILLDPSGAMFNIMRPIPQGDMPVHPPGTPGTMGWNELHSGDWKQGWEFYSGMFGWKKMEALDMGPVGTYQTFGTDGLAFGGMMNRHPSMPMPAWVYYWNVDSIEAAVARVNSAGGKVLMGPHQVPGGSWIIHAMDPQGGMFGAMSKNK